MSQTSQGEERATRAGGTTASRKRAAVETLTRHEAALRRTARRYSLCADDAEDALQRAIEILLVKAPSDDQRELVRWTQTVVKHEALAVRRERERILGGPAAAPSRPDAEDWVTLIPAEADGPPERAERREAVARSREALSSLKPQELRALSLLAEGYSYAEIGEITGFSHTKVNRCLAEGRERFRSLLSRGEDGRRCAEMGPLLSAFCDGEAGGEEAAALREHLRACAGCRATLRAYRAAPRAAAALVPSLPLGRSLLDRAHEALAGVAARLGGGAGGDTALSQVAVAGGARGAGTAALAKALAICLGTAGGAAACVATGVLPAPLGLLHDSSRAPVVEREHVAEGGSGAGVDYEPEPAPPLSQPPAREPDAKGPASAEPKSAAATPEAGSSGAVEYAPPEPPAAPATEAPSEAPAPSSVGNPAGEFGP